MKISEKERQTKLALQDILRKWEERRLEVWGKDEKTYMALVDCISDLEEVAKKIIITTKEDIEKHLGEGPDVCGINCDCDDSCLEFFCRCGDSVSSNRIWQCDTCGEYVIPS